MGLKNSNYFTGLQYLIALLGEDVLGRSGCFESDRNPLLRHQIMKFFLSFWLSIFLYVDYGSRIQCVMGYDSFE